MPRLLLASLAFTATAAAQIPYPLFASTYSHGSDTRGASFTAPTSFFITQLNVPNEQNHPDQFVQVGRFASPPTGLLQPITDLGTFLNHPAGTPIATNILIHQGDEVLIQGACGPPLQPGIFAKSYGTGGGTFQTNILGTPTTLYRAGSQTNLAVTGGTGPCFGGQIGAIGRVEVWISTPAGFATKLDFGTGCGTPTYNSFYELFDLPTNPNDLGNSSFALTRTATGYTVNPAATALRGTQTATNLHLGDDAEIGITFALGTLTMPTPGGPVGDLVIQSNGLVSTDTNGISWAPTAGAFLNLPHTCWAIGWHDLRPRNGPVGAGGIYVDETATHFYVIYDAVESWGAPGPGNTYELHLDKTTGSVEYVFGTIDNLGNDYLCGFTVGGGSNDPGSTNLSALSWLTTSNVELGVLALHGDARPLLGTAVTMTVREIPPSAVLAGIIYGLSNPNLNLAGFGMPGCFRYAAQDAVVLLFPGGQSTASNVFQLPNDPGLTGVRVFVTGAAYDPPHHNPLGGISSNGVRLRLGVL